MSSCMSFKKSLIDLIVRELDVVQSLVSLINVDLFGKSFDLQRTSASIFHFQAINLFPFGRVYSKVHQAQMLAKRLEGHMSNSTFTRRISNYL